MAEDNQDDSQKTEEPTEKRLREAREKGQVAKSQEVAHWFMILGLTMIVGFLLPSIFNGVGGTLIPFIEKPHAIKLGDGIGELIREHLLDVAAALFLPFLLLMAAAILSGLLQTGLQVSVEPIKPKLEKISPLAGVKRLFSLKSLVEFGKGILKLCLVGAVITLVLWPEMDAIANITMLELGQILELTESLSFRVLIAALSVMTLIAALDFAFQRFQHMKQLRMSKQDLKDEYKQTEGDPMVKGRLRQLRSERARQRMMSAVPEADVVVTNPTHFAVCLKYEHGVDDAPRVTAKGVDHLALRIRELAQEHGIPQVENPPLARALYAAVDIDRQVPPEHYKAVAEVISYVMKMGGRRKKPGGGAGARR